MTKMTSQKLAPNAIQNAEDFKISKIKFESHIITKNRRRFPTLSVGSRRIKRTPRRIRGNSHCTEAKMLPPGFAIEREFL